MIANNDQRYVVEEAKKWNRLKNEPLFQFAGGPGTGKSVVLNMIADELNIDRNRIAPMSFIGAAAIVMRTKGFRNAKTAHSWLYTPTDIAKTDRMGNVVMNNYFNTPTSTLGFDVKALNNIDYIFIDEAWSMPYSLRVEIERRGIPMIACGDPNQLPPVGDKPGFLFNGKIHHLREIMRQAKGSGIIFLADRIINNRTIHKGVYGNVLVIEEDELTDQMISLSEIVIACKNNTRDKFNKHIREDMLGCYSDIPIHGEQVVCRKNNHKIEVDGINLANGLLGKVTSFPDVGGFDGKTFKMDFTPNILNQPFRNVKCDYKYFISNHDQRQNIKNDKYAIGEKFEFGYCITDHMAQGSQFNGGIYIQEYLNKNINMNLDYTGVTRFSDWCIFVIQKKRYW